MAEAKGSKRAAIDFEEIEDTPLQELSADRFLEALSRENLLSYLPLWPEKKKYELYVEPENIGRIPVGRIRDILKGEKKKVEYELPWGGLGDGRPQPMPFDPGRYEGLVSHLADELEGRLRSRLGR